jgi:S1-C subfamily serine protease
MAGIHADKARQMYEKRVAVYGDNARLGIVLRSERDPKTDGIGAMVQALTPGGPAEEAGLQAGDIITKFNGEVLGLPGGVPSEDAVGPTDRLMERAATLKDGDQVTLEVRRGTATKTLTVTARRLYGSRVKVFTVPEVPEIPDIHVDVEPFEFEFAEQFEAGAPVAWTAFTSDLKGIEMVTLNPELGEYFGAKEGILVVKAPADSPFQLKAGDVILKVGDREPKSPAQAMRVLRSYAPTETVNIEVMRNRARMTVTAHIPERKTESFRYKTAPVVAPAPPPPPAPAAPPAPPARSNV